MAKKVKGRLTLVKLVSTAATGFIKTLYVPRQLGVINQVRYDPLAKRHVLFKESRNRRLATSKQWGFGRPLK
ncbi:MRPL39 mitochondrial ribosomal protein-like protein of the large subunit [Lipomyces japonicus]|uniref:mitochondrial 54S ribosomal protein bL33m n=1 Tax=Lipomyces japonicus TaxID=56871 RepID=UPI0034CD3E6A